MLPSQMIPKQPCQCNPSWLLDAKHAILIFSTHSFSVFMPSYAFKWIFLIFISCLSFLKASKLYDRCNHIQKKCFKKPFFHETTLCLFNLPFLLSKQHKFSFLYSLSLFYHFCPVKRNGKYFAEKWTEQKVLIIKVVGLYSTYQKYKRIGVPGSYQFGENWTWVFSTKKLHKSKHFFSNY